MTAPAVAKPHPRVTCARAGCTRTLNPTTDHQGRLRGGARRRYCSGQCQRDARLDRDRAHRRYWAALGDLIAAHALEARDGTLPGMPPLPPVPPFVLKDWT